MNKLIVIIITAILSGCTFGSPSLSPKERVSDEILNKVIFDMQKKYDLYACGTGGEMMDEIRMLAISFFYYHPIDIDEGRQLLISAIQHLVDEVNNNPEIRPYLANYPFQAKNIEIRVFICNPDGSNINPGMLSVVSSINGVLKYKIDKPGGRGFITVHQETYEEALEALKLQDPKSA
jgi:hypothetical protein